MRPDDAVIDLGDERWSADDLPRPGRRYGRGYRLVVLVATLAALLPLAGSHRPTPLITAPLWVADEPGVVLGDRVYTFSNTGRLTARSLRDGAIEWQLSGLTPNAYVAELNAALLGHVMYETQTDTGGDRHFLRTTTRVVDPEDGRVLATVPGDPYGRSADGSVTVFGSLSADPASCDEWSQCLDLRGVDARTGAVVWQLPYRADREPVWSSLDGVIESVGLVDAGGRLVLHDSATGRPVQAVAIPFWPDDVDATSPAQRMQIGMISLQGAAVIGVREKLGTQGWTVAVSSLDLDTGRSWSTAFAAVDSGYRYPSQCGRWLCVADQRHAIVLDRDTGVEVARIDGYAMELGYPDLLGLWHFGEGSPGSVRVFDPVAGVGRAVIPGSAQSVSGRPELVVVSAQSDARGSDLYRVDPDGQTHVVMTIESAGHCQARREYLVCSEGDTTYDDTLSLVRLWVFALPAGVVTRP